MNLAINFNHFKVSFSTERHYIKEMKGSGDYCIVLVPKHEPFRF